MRGRSAIVTGLTSGIGLGIATALAAEGVNIMLNGFGDAGEIKKLRQDLADTHGVRTAYSPADMSKPAEIHKLVRTAETEFGAVDILVNNAGIQFVANIEDFPDDQWDAVIAINLSAAFHTIKAALPGMKRRRFGRIINIASAHGLVASVGKVAYVAAKHGLIGITKTVALEAANDGVTANAICPGWVLTPLVEKQIAARAKAEGTSLERASSELLGEKQPLLQFTTPAKLGALAVFLCSEMASTTTGASFSMDGGWVAQ